jgi:hypothetical protein
MASAVVLRRALRAADRIHILAVKSFVLGAEIQPLDPDVSRSALPADPHVPAALGDVVVDAIGTVLLVTIVYSPLRLILGLVALARGPRDIPARR